MKKVGIVFSIVLLSVVVFLLGFKYEPNIQPHTYYEVYLEDELLGMIESKEELEKYINNQGDSIRDNVKAYKTKVEAIEAFNNNVNKLSEENKSLSNKDKVQLLIENADNYNISEIDVDSLTTYLDDKVYEFSNADIEEMNEYINSNEIYLSVDNVYTPNGIEIKKVYTYHTDITTVPEIYKEIILKKSCTISGYRFTIKNKDENQDDIIIYTTDTNIFSSAVENLINIFVDDKEYKKYKENKQDEIATTGSIITNIYVEQNITYKAVNISVDEKIYTDANDLSAYLLYGDQFTEKKVTVSQVDSIETLAFNNKISVEEFLIFNKQYTSRDNLLVPGTEVTISTVDPKLQIVVETHEISDKETNFTTVEEYDENLTQGSMVITQEGENGLERVTQNIKTINGEIAYVDPVDKQTIKSFVSKVIAIGTKYIPSVGSVSSWGWPTNSGYTISSYYGYRLQVFGEGNFHSGVDIAGTGYGSPVYATNNGVITKIGWANDYGYHIILDHNNGYYSVYGHMKGFASGLSVGSTVERGQTIGYVGTSGWATGPHLHFEIRTCAKFSCTTNPLPYLR